MAVVVLAVVAQRIFVAAHPPLSWAAAAAVVAVLIDPIVDTLDRRIPRLPAVIIALLVAGGRHRGVIYLAFDELSNGLDRLGEAARRAADELEARDDSVGDLARDVDAPRRVDLFVDALDERVTGGDEVIRSTAGTAPTYLMGGILTLFLMSYGPRLARSALEQLDDPSGAPASPPSSRSRCNGRRAIFLTLGEGLVGTGGGRRGLPAGHARPGGAGPGRRRHGAAPHVGLVLGSLPLILLVLALRSDVAAIGPWSCWLAAQLVDSFVLRRRIADRSVHIGLLVPWVVVLVGYAVYGVGGAAYGLAFAVFGLALIDEFGKDRWRGIPVPEEDEAASGRLAVAADEAGEADAGGGDGGDAVETKPSADVAGPVSTA